MRMRMRMRHSSRLLLFSFYTIDTNIHIVLCVVLSWLVCVFLSVCRTWGEFYCFFQSLFLAFIILDEHSWRCQWLDLARIRCFGFGLPMRVHHNSSDFAMKKCYFRHIMRLSEGVLAMADRFYHCIVVCNLTDALCVPWAFVYNISDWQTFVETGV